MSKKVLFEGDGVKFSIEHYENRYGLEIASSGVYSDTIIGTPAVEDGIVARGVFFSTSELFEIIEEIEVFVHHTETQS